MKATVAGVTFSNPWPQAQRPGDRIQPVPERAPDNWYLLSPNAAGVIGGAILDVLREHPARNSVGDRDWLAHRVRERLQGFREAGDGHARDALAELEGVKLNNSQLLQAAVAKFLEAGGEIPWLRAERARLDARLRKLEPFERGDAS